MPPSPFELDHRKEVTVEELQQHGYENTGVQYFSIEIWKQHKTHALLERVQGETKLRVVSVYSMKKMDN